MALYVGVLLVIVEPASVHCTADPTSQGGWIFLTLLSPPIWLVPFVGCCWCGGSNDSLRNALWWSA